MLHLIESSMNHSRTDDGIATVLRIRGELDALSASDLRPVLNRLLEDQRLEVTVDLSELRLIDSSGVGTLVSLYKRVRAAGGVVRFVGVTSQPLVIFKLLRLDIVFGLVEQGSEVVYGLAPQGLEAGRTEGLEVSR
jgi:anti-sigma B factor antagonist